MKNLILFLFVSMLFCSCLDLRFTQSMPASSPALNEFPAELQGKFKSKHNGDTLVVSNKQIVPAEITLDENTVLKYTGKYYILNSKKGDGWNIVVIKLKGKSTLKLYAFDIADGKKRKKLNAISTLKEVYDEEGGLDYISAGPDDVQFEKMLKSRALIEIDHFVRVK